jgi:hypothetical protein
MSPILGIFASSYLSAVGDYESIATVIVGSGGTSSITFSSIPSTYKHLQIRYLGRNLSGAGTSDTFIYARFNGDSSSNYAWHYVLGDGSSTAASGSSTQAQMAFGAITQNGVSANIFAGAIADILDYSSVNKNKTVRVLSGNDRNGGGVIVLNSGLWSNSSNAISSMTISSDNGFAQHSSFALYGVK